jgi:hypothetical protein
MDITLTGVPRCKARKPRWSVRPRSGPCWGLWPPPALRRATGSCSVVAQGQPPGHSHGLADVGDGHRGARAGRGCDARAPPRQSREDRRPHDSAAPRPPGGAGHVAAGARRHGDPRAADPLPPCVSRALPGPSSSGATSLGASLDEGGCLPAPGCPTGRACEGRCLHALHGAKYGAYHGICGVSRTTPVA